MKIYWIIKIFLINAPFNLISFFKYLDEILDILDYTFLFKRVSFTKDSFNIDFPCLLINLRYC
jgi:hypothetical protein